MPRKNHQVVADELRRENTAYLNAQRYLNQYQEEEEDEEMVQP